MGLTLQIKSRISITVFILASLTACSDSGITCGAFYESGSTVSQVYNSAVVQGFSGSVLVRYKGDILLNEAAGFADRELAIPFSTGTVSTMGSITKQYTGALILSLQEAGMLSVDDTLADHFINVPQDKADITIHQLLTHSAGFPAGLGPDAQPISRIDYLELAWSTPLLFKPGTAFSYANTGYSIAAAVAEKVTGQSYEVALNERLLTLANVNETGYVIPDWSDRVIAKGYSGSRVFDQTRTSIAAAEGPYWNLRGNGGLLTTTSDMLKWHDALAGIDMLSANSIEQLQTRHVSNNYLDESYGYGWNIADTPVGELFFHNGGNGHHFASMRRFIEEDLVVIMLSNEMNESSICLPTNLARASAPKLESWAGL